ncbi:hypothetical protein TNCV_4976991 [Trichonephila clavipes]|nr:hypothetical protein TNCV_4976991 [Trichonephila clavipes]
MGSRLRDTENLHYCEDYALYICRGCNSSQWCGVEIWRGGTSFLLPASTLDRVSTYQISEGILKSPSLSLLYSRAFGDGPVAGVPGGQGIESWLACLEFEPSATKDPPCRAAMHVKSIQS